MTRSFGGSRLYPKVHNVVSGLWFFNVAAVVALTSLRNVKQKCYAARRAVHQQVKQSTSNLADLLLLFLIGFPVKTHKRTRTHTCEVGHIFRRFLLFSPVLTILNPRQGR